MANISDPTQQESSGWGFGQLATSPYVGLVVSVGSNIVLHTVLNELHEILKTILTGNMIGILQLNLTQGPRFQGGPWGRAKILSHNFF